MNSRVIPLDNNGSDHLSRESRRRLPHLPSRLQSTVNEKILELGVPLRLLSKAAKIFQGEIEDLLEKCKDISNATLENLFETEFKVNTLWQKVFARKWRPTRKNKRVLCENILQNCMIYLRSEYIGRPNRENILKTFGSLIALDLLEFAPVVNVIVFFYMGEVTAGWILLGCIIFERLLQVLASMALESLSLSSVLASFVGVKPFLTSYHVACHGLHAKVEGSKVTLVTPRLFQKGINAVFASTPQAMLNAYTIFSKLKTGESITGTMRIQIFVIMTACFCTGASLTNVVQEADRKYAKQGYYKSMTQILLKENSQFSATLLKGGWNICHHMIISCALGALVAKAFALVWDNKNTFKNSPPRWLSKEWLTLIPKQHRDEVWDGNEYEELCLRLEHVEQEFAAREFQPLLDDEEVNHEPKLEDVHQEKENLPKNDHTDEVNENENRNNSPTGESTSSEEETAVVVNEVVQEEQNELRQKVIENINKRRSSYFGSLTALPLIDESDQNDIPEMLKDLFERSETLKIDEIIEESKKALDNGLFDKLLGPDK
eukprot:g160.t1